MMQRSAFTLVELSIVLVILGLLIGGVLTGQSLIRAAELRSITTQSARFITATHTFRDKYFALPGDMTNATSYWGVADPTPATCATTVSTDSKTCNGDGDGQILPTANSGELFRFWQQLANAGLIEGSYTGASAGGSNNYTSTNVNSPTGRINASLWHARNWGNFNGAQWLFSGPYGNTLSIGGLYSNGWPATAMLKAEEVYNIDTKTDDGLPAQGKVVAIIGLTFGAAACTTAASGTDVAAVYQLNTTSINCGGVAFRNAF